jgi:hypothetical protein
LGRRLEIGEHALDRARPGVAAVPQIEHKPRISNGISSKTGGRRVIPAKESFHFSEQIHLSLSLWSHATRRVITFQRNSYLSMRFPITTKDALMMNDARVALERLCAERGEDFAGLSRMLGRNSAYIQQYVRRGIPRRLGEEERRKLARYFGVPESLLGGPPSEDAGPNGLLTVKRHPVTVSAGPGALVNDELGKPCFAFDERWLKALTPSAASNLSVVRVEGDSMAPTLNAGDDILVDLGDSAERLRDGIYVLRIDDALVVKRVALNPVGRRVTIQSDNPAYPDWPDCSLDQIKCIGRVIWSGRRIV